MVHYVSKENFFVIRLKEYSLPSGQYGRFLIFLLFWTDFDTSILTLGLIQNILALSMF